MAGLCVAVAAADDGLTGNTAGDRTRGHWQDGGNCKTCVSNGRR